ncbi:hypothetical protein D3C78_1032500 [compost metagenome]
MQYTEGAFSYQCSAVRCHTADRFRYPSRVTAEQLVVVRCAQKFYDTKLHHKMVINLLSFFLCQSAFVNIPFEIDIKEGGDASEAHRCAVLLFNRCQIAEVQPLHSLFRVLSGLGNIIAVCGGHPLQLIQRSNLLRMLLALSDDGFRHFGLFCQLDICFFRLNETIDPVQSYAAVISDNTSPPVSIRQASNDSGFASITHICRISVENTLVMRLANIREQSHDLIRQFEAIGLAGILHHSNSAIRLNGALERLIRLNADDLLQLTIEVSGIMRDNG